MYTISRRGWTNNYLTVSQEMHYLAHRVHHLQWKMFVNILGARHIVDDFLFKHYFLRVTCLLVGNTTKFNKLVFSFYKFDPTNPKI